ncbi:hypothetical protein CONPUDRAFT_119225 [Coniophora puteana RWD-64-598 SS2]|uniref:CCL2-like lectin domain-containing protein n=1 Tax=Coniophora puteana (strain RWD-64-598) TaxID=741705 RepID=A0A5M3MXC1_CONPW|nr:uncharacterized protein CONPUDRAFT_119225 [Coniophora puteana RWD-64-598 SS2]EIW83809.1 hypothetical protein CONPUDRAFT_119225 [Coniophora puteana RWD-64-598 SS2]
MSKPSPGRYVIYHRIQSSSGERLAITYNGQNGYPTVNPLTYEDNQIWIIQNYNDTTQSISPASNSNLQCGWGDNAVIVLPPQAYVWIIRNNASGYTIQDGGQTVYWGLDEAEEKQNVTIKQGEGGIFQSWILKQV